MSVQLETCPGCIARNRRITELQGELAEWADRQKRAAPDAEAGERLYRWRTKLSAEPSAVKTIELLLEKCGRPVHKQAIINHASLNPDRLVESSNLGDVFICKARQALRKAYGEPVIETIWGQGFVINRENAAKLRAWLDA